MAPKDVQRRVTVQLGEALRLLGARLLDHADEITVISEAMAAAMTGEES